MKPLRPCKRLKVFVKTISRNLIESLRNIRMTSRDWKVLLIVLLMSLSPLVAGCASNSKTPRKETPSYTIDASLMVTPKLTEKLLKELSQ